MTLKCTNDGVCHCVFRCGSKHTFNSHRNSRVNLSWGGHGPIHQSLEGSEVQQHPGFEPLHACLPKTARGFISQHHRETFPNFGCALAELKARPLGKKNGHSHSPNSYCGAQSAQRASAIRARFEQSALSTISTKSAKRNEMK